MTKYVGPSLLTANHDVEGFTSGSETLDDWLKRFALHNQRASMTKTHVITKDDTNEVVGFFSLTTGGVMHEEAPARVTKGVARHPIPVVILARLAVHSDHQNQGLGLDMLQAALRNTYDASQTIGIRALLIHAKDERARRWYMKHANFDPSPVDELQLMLLMKDLVLAMQ